MNQYSTVAFHTLGCKLNYAETSTISRIFINNGYKKVEFQDGADVYVINTCSVTENADKECKKIVKKALTYSPDGYIVIVGCYAQLKPDEIAAIPGVDLVLGASEKFNILNYIPVNQKKTKPEIHSCSINDVEQFIGSYSLNDRTRSFLKVQDGCDYVCTYCTIPLARGKSRSDTIENTVKRVKEIAANGVKEIVLSGVNVGDFGKNMGESFLDLIKVLDEVREVTRFRISSIEPNLLKDEIIEFVASSKKFVPHFHIPLQSGSDKILRAMKRRYNIDLYRNRINRIKKIMPYCCIGADVIVGFPGETDNDFLETYEFIKNLDICYLHVFTYSERENTESVNIKDIVPVDVRKKRNGMLRNLSEKKRRHFYEQNLGRTCQVLFESNVENGCMFGFTENYLKVRYPYNHQLINRVLALKLNSIDSEGVMIADALLQNN